MGNRKWSSSNLVAVQVRNSSQRVYMVKGDELGHFGDTPHTSRKMGALECALRGSLIGTVTM